MGDDEAAEYYDRRRCYYGDRDCPCMMGDTSQDRCTYCGSAEWHDEEPAVCMGCEREGTRMSAVLALWPVTGDESHSEGKTP